MSDSVRIGITGHRYLHAVPALIGTIHEALALVEERWEGYLLQLYTPLAPGADQLAAVAAMEHGFDLVLVLPFEQERYLEAFPEENRETFHMLMCMASDVVALDGGLDDEAAYRQTGFYLVEQLDCLVALWNGQPPQGPGGTGEVVEAFRRSGKPLIWIYTDNMRPDHPEPLPAGMNQGDLALENWE